MPTTTPRRAGFTLVEMLVALALVALMMSMFGQIFQLAGGSISTQRGIMENDQRSRTLQTVIKADLDKRSFRYVMPFWPGEEVANSAAEIGKRRGYFYISENDPTNDTDDVLQFTVDATVSKYNPDVSQYVGRAIDLVPADDPGDVPGWFAGSPSQYNNLNLVLGNPNQPDMDDRVPGNRTGSSIAAEVVYFMRGSNLYRRVQLIRNDGDPTANLELFPSPPADINKQFFNPINATAADSFSGQYRSGARPAVNTSNFWGDFDYSAYPQLTDGLYQGATFPSFSSLENLDTGPSGARFSVAVPSNRFGFRHRIEPTGVAATIPSLGGRPREYTSDGVFFGRYLQEETSDTTFVYPHAFLGPINRNLDPLGSEPAAFAYAAPYPVSGPLTSTTLFAPLESLQTSIANAGTAANPSSAVSVGGTLLSGPRRGEDLLLSNVHGFDVDVWDEGTNDGFNFTPRFVDLGTDNGDFQISQRLNRWYGPQEVPLGAANPANGANTPPVNVNLVFDTWHHQMHQPASNSWVDPLPAPTPGGVRAGFDFSRDGDVQPVAEIVDGANPPVINGVSFDVDGNDVIDAGAANQDADETRPPFRPQLRYAVPARPIRFPLAAARTIPFYAALAYPYALGQLAREEWRPDRDYQEIGTEVFLPRYSYDATPTLVREYGDFVMYRLIERRQTGATFTIDPARLITPSLWPQTPGLVFEENTGTDGDSFIWQAVDNRKPLRAVRITIRFVDPTTQQMRNLSIVHSLVD